MWLSSLASDPTLVHILFIRLGHALFHIAPTSLFRHLCQSQPPPHSLALPAVLFYLIFRVLHSVHTHINYVYPEDSRYIYDQLQYSERPNRKE